MIDSFRYFPVGVNQRQWGLYVTCAGHHTTPPGAVFPSPEHPDEYFFSWKHGRTLHEWQLCLLTAGKGIVDFKTGRTNVSAGSLIVLPPGCWHRYRPNAKTGWTTCWIGFGGDLVDRLITGAGFALSGAVKDCNRQPAVRQMFASTISDLIDTPIRTPFSAAASIPMLIAALAESTTDDKADTSVKTQIARAQSYINSHQSGSVDFYALARELGMSYRSFRYQFQRETGFSPLQYLLERRLTRAKNLLASTDLPIMDIATELGFNSTWYFSHFFQKHTRQSPAAYRKRNLKIASNP